MKVNKISKDYRQLNDFIRGEMTRQKISQDMLAYRLNLTRVSVNHRLSGKVDWTLWEIMNVFEILGISFEYERREHEIK